MLPSPYTVSSGQYATLSRLIFVYVQRGALEQKAAVRDFTQFLVEGAPRFASYTRFVPLTSANYQEQAQRLRRMESGSVYSK